MIGTRSRFYSVFFGLLILLLSATMGFGATWYVAADGSDGGNGTQDAPYKTIQHTVNQAGNGDTVMVEAGTYSGGVSIDSDRVILKSVDGAETTTIRGGTYGIELTGNGLTVEGFTIESNDHGFYCPNPQSEDVTLSSNSIRDFTEEGIYFEEDIADCSVTIAYNMVVGGTCGIGLDGDAGANDQPVTIRIVNNTVTDSGSRGISFNDLYSGTVEISGNTLTDCNDYGIYADETGHNGIEISFKVQDNTIALSGGKTGTCGIRITIPERTTWVTGNTIDGGYHHGIYAECVGCMGHDPVLFYVEDNVVTNSEYGIYLYKIFDSFGGSTYVRGNTISAVERSGVYIEYLTCDSEAEGFTFSFEDNIISNCSRGLKFEYPFHAATGTATIRGNSFRNNDYGLYIYYLKYFAGSTLTIGNNDFAGNNYGLYNDSGTLIDATDNWWGDATGPYDGRLNPVNPDYNNREGQGDEVTALIDYAGWRETPCTGGENGGGDGSSGGCAVGSFFPAMLLLVLPLAGLLRRK